MISQTEKQINSGMLEPMHEEELEHEEEPLKGLFNKYKGARSN